MKGFWLGMAGLRAGDPGLKSKLKRRRAGVGARPDYMVCVSGLAA